MPMFRRLKKIFWGDTASFSSGWLLLAGISWLMVGIVFGRLLMFVTRIVAARLLGKAAIGEFGLIESTVTMFVSYAALGMVVAVSKNLAECYQDDALRAGRILGTVFLLSGSLFALLLLALFISSPRLAASLSPNPDFLTNLRIGMLLALLVPAGLATAILNAFQAFRHVTFTNFIQGLASLILTFMLVPICGLNGYLLAFGGGLILTVLYQGMIIVSLCRKHNIRVRLKGMGLELSLIWRYGLPSMVSGVLIGPVTWATRAFLAKQKGGIGELGLYVAAFSLCSILTTVSTLLYNVTIPVLSSSKSYEEKYIGINRSIFLYWLAGIGMGIPIIALANHLVVILLGPQFINAGRVLAILALAVGTRIFFTAFGSLLIVIDRVWHMTMSTIVGDPIFFGATLLLAPLWGAKGLALAYLISSLVILTLLYGVSARQMGWRGLPGLGVLLTITSLGAAWLIQGIHGLGLALISTALLLSLFVVSSGYLALRYELLGAIAAKVPFLVRNR